MSSLVSPVESQDISANCQTGDFFVLNLRFNVRVVIFLYIISRFYQFRYLSPFLLLSPMIIFNFILHLVLYLAIVGKESNNVVNVRHAISWDSVGFPSDLFSLTQTSHSSHRLSLLPVPSKRDVFKAIDYPHLIEINPSDDVNTIKTKWNYIAIECPCCAGGVECW